MLFLDWNGLSIIEVPLDSGGPGILWTHLELDTWNWSLIQANISGHPQYGLSNLLTATNTPTLHPTYTVYEVLTSLYTE